MDQIVSPVARRRICALQPQAIWCWCPVLSAPFQNAASVSKAVELKPTTVSAEQEQHIINDGEHSHGGHCGGRQRDVADLDTLSGVWYRGGYGGRDGSWKQVKGQDSSILCFW
ncbi:hypothetical protein CONLIGDRAFT_694056 [Coniochaeta ligniaria NRRL 30616]|uniref:Uncharacterized protein n=1 Tax=Coniochaeta ligniaria NRRL 30616 TaxID=1408157 RepID=A0A1J7I6N2_9PEZI|nr:hypothetical protein CONLIGDRAFT_694056 [Coniochaeta ligniaria NRRL 30616]